MVGVGKVAKAFAVSRKTVWRWEGRGELPEAARIGPRRMLRWYPEVIAPLLLADGLRVPESWGVSTEVAA